MAKGEEKHKLITMGSVLSNRLNLALSMGMQTFNGDRDIFQVLGYPTTLNYEDYYARYKRQDIASAVIKRPVTATWRGPIKLVENHTVEETQLETAFAELDKELNIKDMFMRLDTLTSLGEYGVILLGLDDVHNIEGFLKPVAEGERKLLYVKPFGQGGATISKTDVNPSSPRYGLPLIYNLTIEDLSNASSRTGSSNGTTISVHYSRVVHIVQDTLESEVIGTPVLEAVFNSLLNIEKISGGDAEMFWRGARPGYQGKVDKDYMMTPDTKKDLEDQIDEYEHNLRRILVNEGVDFESLAQQIADPSTHIDIQIQLISAKTSIPKRILTGSERGELSSSQDRDSWDTYISSRRTDYAEIQIVKKFIDICIKYKILPTPEEDNYSVIWEDLFAPSEKSKAEVGKIRANALREYATMPAAERIIPPTAFMEFFLGLSDTQINRVKKISEEEIISESNSINNPDFIEQEMNSIENQDNIEQGSANPTTGSATNTNNV